MKTTGNWLSSEASYQSHTGLIDVVLPGHGGLLQADGTWQQSAAKLGTAFSLALRGMARAAGQRYVPVLDPGHTDQTNLKAVLDDTDLWTVAADDALSLARNRFDAPWNGILYDACHVSNDYIDLHGQFITYLSQRVRNAGLSFELSYPGFITADAGYWISLDVLADVADAFDFYMYGGLAGYLQPYWHMKASLDNAVAHNCQNVYLGIGTFSRYWTDGGSTITDLSYSAAMDEIGDSPLQWVEPDSGALIREYYAETEGGYLWLSGGDVVRNRLGLADQYGLDGVMIFRPGMGNESMWLALSRWKRQMTLSTLPTMYGKSDIFMNRGKGRRRCR